MSLATRCTACGTVFRVVQDQLKVSEGWVRCGRCNEVFNGLEGLFDLEREAPPEGAAIEDGAAQPHDADAPQPGAAAPAAAPAHPATAPAARADPAFDERIDDELFGGSADSPDTQMARAFDDPRVGAQFGDARLDPELLTDEAALRAAQRSTEKRPGRSTRPARGGEAKPAFLREAERAARWSSPGMRFLLVLFMLALAATLTLQAAHHFRDTVALRWPQTQPALAQWCAWMQCTISPPRRIEDIFVESTTLARIPGRDGFRFAVNLRNRGTLPAAVPAVELNLTDGQGQLVARRVLSPKDFGTTLAALLPGTDTSLQLQLSTGDAPIAGYTVEVFYP